MLLLKLPVNFQNKTNKKHLAFSLFAKEKSLNLFSVHPHQC